MSSTSSRRSGCIEAMFKMRAALWVLAAFPLLTPASAQQRKITTKNEFGDRVVFYPRPGTRILRVSLGSDESLTGDRFDRLVRDALKVIAAEARAQNSDVFAVTNMFCSSTQWRVGCAVEGAYLRPNERIAVRPQDNQPVYFWTDSALASQIPSDWTSRLNLNDGLTGKVQIEPGAIPTSIIGEKAPAEGN